MNVCDECDCMVTRSKHDMNMWICACIIKPKNNQVFIRQTFDDDRHIDIKFKIVKANKQYYVYQSDKMFGNKVWFDYNIGIPTSSLRGAKSYIAGQFAGLERYAKAKKVEFI